MVGTIAQQLRARREEVGLSQGDLAWFARVSRGTVSNIERGKVDPVGQGTALDISTALGLAPEGVMGLQEEVDPLIGAAVLRRITQYILILRDGDEGYEATPDRGGARTAADTLRDFLASLEGDEGIPVGDSGWNALSTLGAFLVEALDPKNRADRKVIEYFQDLGWSEDDALANKSVQDLHEKAEAGEQVLGAEPLVTMPHADYKRLLETMEELTKKVTSYQDHQAQQLRTFNRLPVKLQSVLSEGHVTEWSQDEIPGGVAAHIFMRREETDVDPIYTLIAIRNWENLQLVANAAYEMLAKRGVDALDDPLSAFDAMEVALLIRAQHPDILEELEGQYPGRLAELKSRFPELGDYMKKLKENSGGETE